MSLQTASLNSGSNGNCYLISNGQDTVFIDVGLSCKEVERRMERLNLPISNVKAIFISHEHVDHISGVSVLSKKYQRPVYITPSTLRNSPIKVEEHLLRPFVAHNPVIVGNLTVTGFLKKHDASDPHSFVIEGNAITIGVFTDIGEPNEEFTHYFKQCHAAFLETNYDDELLMTGRYPERLKRRISGPKGHLSNKQAVELYTNHKADFLSHLFLSHISKENNTHEHALAAFSPYAKDVNVTIASRYEETELFEISGKQFIKTKVQVKRAKTLTMQLSLF
jgi:phosphoribosyl 1,2-cyclic phosphodiesterase